MCHMHSSHHLWAIQYRLKPRSMDQCKWTVAALVAGAGAASLVGGLYLGYRSGRKVGAGLVTKHTRMKSQRGEYISNHNVEDIVLGQLREMSLAHRRGRMTTGVQTRKLLAFLCRTIKAKKVLDIGVFTGCSSYAMAMALPEDGKVIACDVSEEYTNLGRPYWDRGGVSEKIDLRIKPATKTLQELIDGGEEGTFDAIFIDADKANYPKYFELGMQLLRVGGIFVVDNTLWGGMVADPAIQEEDTIAIREINYLMRDNPGVDYVLLDIDDGVNLAQKL